MTALTRNIGTQRGLKRSKSRIDLLRVASLRGRLAGVASMWATSCFKTTKTTTTITTCSMRGRTLLQSAWKIKECSSAFKIFIQRRSGRLIAPGLYINSKALLRKIKVQRAPVRSAYRLRSAKLPELIAKITNLRSE